MKNKNFNIIEGKFEGEDVKIALVVSRFNHLITDRLLEGALDCLYRHNVKPTNIDVIKVPGSFEIPGTVNFILSQKHNYNAVICLGAVIRGETPHFDFVASEVSKGIANLSIKYSIPIIYGIITTDTVEQAIDRAGVKTGNKGFQAALSALEMISLYDKLSSKNYGN